MALFDFRSHRASSGVAVCDDNIDYEKENRAKLDNNGNLIPIFTVVAARAAKWYQETATYQNGKCAGKAREAERNTTQIRGTGTERERIFKRLVPPTPDSLASILPRK